MSVFISVSEGLGAFLCGEWSGEIVDASNKNCLMEWNKLMA